MKKSEYHKGTWHDKPVYKCAFCHFDSFDYKALEKHIKDNHVKAKPRVQMKALIYDRFGNEIKER